MAKPRAPVALDLFDSLQPDEEGLGFRVTIKRSARRRTLEIIIRDGQVYLMTPQFISTDDGLAFVRSKREWVLNTLAKQQALLDEVPEKRYEDGELFTYLGNEFPLKIFSASKRTVMLNDGALHVGIRTGKSDRDKVRKAVHGWYKAKAVSLLSEKSHNLAAAIGKTVTDVKVRATKTKWGHCTADGVLQFNWYVMAAPEWVVDYLVAHEVSHLKYRHHRATFWAQVEALCPQMRDAKKWLRENSHKIVF